jgi:hypothetical protein
MKIFRSIRLTDVVGALCSLCIINALALLDFCIFSGERDFRNPFDLKQGKKTRIVCWIAFFISVCGMNVFASKVVSVNHQACKYIITLPEGWDTIPQSFLKEKEQLKPFNIDLGVYPVEQGDYTKGNYALVCFMPAVKTLNAFTFKQIVADMTKANNQGEIKTDTLQARFNKMNTVVKDGNFRIFSYYSIKKDTVAMESCQMLQPTKFGYISIMSYKKNEGAVSMEELSALLSKTVTVHPDYKYAEYKKDGITLKHILISLTIGIIVYALITFISRKKK